MEGLSSTKTKEVSLPLPKSLDTRIYVRVSQLEKASVILLSTATAEELGTAVPMGSFVYALPDVSHINSSILVLSLADSDAALQ